MSARLLSTSSMIARNAGALSRAYHGGGYQKTTTMNDLPVPQGDWQEAHHRANTKYNAIFATGIIVLAATIGFVKSTGIIHFNFSPPKSLD